MKEIGNPTPTDATGAKDLARRGVAASGAPVVHGQGTGVHELLVPDARRTADIAKPPTPAATQLPVFRRDAFPAEQGNGSMSNTLPPGVRERPEERETGRAINAALGDSGTGDEPETVSRGKMPEASEERPEPSGGGRGPIDRNPPQPPRGAADVPDDPENQGEASDQRRIGESPTQSASSLADVRPIDPSDSPSAEMPEPEEPEGRRDEVIQHLREIAARGDVEMGAADIGAICGVSMETVVYLFDHGVIPGRASGSTKDYYQKGDVSVYPTVQLAAVAEPLLEPGGIELMYDYAGPIRGSAKGYALHNAKEHAIRSVLGLPIGDRDTATVVEAVQKGYREKNFLTRNGITEEQIDQARTVAAGRAGFLLAFSPKMKDDPEIAFVPGDNTEGDIAIRTHGRGLSFRHLSRIVPLGPEEARFLEEKLQPAVTVPEEDHGGPFASREELLSVAAQKQAERDQTPRKERRVRTSSIEYQINQTIGPFVEVGGPTQHDFAGKSIINFNRVEKPLIVSNVAPPYIRDGFWKSPIFGKTFGTERPPGLRGLTYTLWGEEPLRVEDESWGHLASHTLDLRLDATDMPEGVGYIGALYASALHPAAEPAFVSREAPRVLEVGGVLVVEGIKDDSLEALKQSVYFEIIKDKLLDRQLGIRGIVARRNAVPYKNISL